jgi:hypothetical protein
LFEVPDRVKAVMFRFVTLAALGACFAPQLRIHAQVTATAPESEVPGYDQRWDFTGGGQYSHFNPSPGRGVAAINLEGVTGAATVWLRSSWGVEGSARILHGTLAVPVNSESIPANPPMHEYLFLFGPNFRIIRHRGYTLGVHALAGAAYGVFDAGFPAGAMPQDVGIYNDKLAFGMGVGSWADVNVTPRWSVRVTSDWQPTHYGLSWQNEFAGSVGIVYKFGYLHSGQ